MSNMMLSVLGLLLFSFLRFRCMWGVIRLMVLFVVFLLSWMVWRSRHMSKLARGCLLFSVSHF